MSATHCTACTADCYEECARQLPPPSELNLKPEDLWPICWCECHVDDHGACLVHGIKPCPKEKARLGEEV